MNELTNKVDSVTSKSVESYDTFLGRSIMQSNFTPEQCNLEHLSQSNNLNQIFHQTGIEIVPEWSYNRPNDITVQTKFANTDNQQISEKETDQITYSNIMTYYSLIKDDKLE